MTSILSMRAIGTRARFYKEGIGVPIVIPLGKVRADVWQHIKAETKVAGREQ